MARYIFIFNKFLLLCLLIYAKVRADEWEQELNYWGRTIFSLTRPDRVKFLATTNILLNFLILVLGLNLLRIFLSSVYRRRQKLPLGRKDNVLLGLENVYIIVTTAVVIITALSFFGIDVKSLFTGLTIVGAAIAIITKDYIANIISGIAISFSDEISIGDYVKIGTHKGKVTDISISRISLLNDDDDIVFIPNNTVFTSEIINFTKKGIRRVSIEFQVNLASIDTIEELERDLVECLKDYHDNIEAGSFKLKIVEILKDSLNLKFQYTLKEINRELEREIRRKTVRRVVNHIRGK
ncbi:MAG: mechanosensitive ion channel [Bacteroidetes bacterium]|nr:mechanosensitive ion channel [Bacteroidota bacterium]